MAIRAAGDRSLDAAAGLASREIQRSGSLCIAVFQRGYQGAGNAHRYGEGGFAGKRALLAVCVGGPEKDYSPRGINGPLEQLLFPITHGTLFFPGMQVLPTFAVYGAAAINAQGMAEAAAAWRGRVERLFDDEPIAFRPQNGGSYPDRHVLADHVAPGQSGLVVHIARSAGPEDHNNSFPTAFAESCYEDDCVPLTSTR